MIAHRNAQSRILRRREKRICKSALCTSQSGRSNSHTGTCRWLNEPLSCPGNSETKPPEGGSILLNLAGPAGFPRSSNALPLGCYAPAGKSLKTCHWHVFLTGFHLIGSNPSQPAMQQKTARRRFNTLRFGWASRIRTYITGTKNQGPAIGRWPSVYALWAFWHYSVFSSVKPRAHVNRRQNQRTRNSQNATALAATTLSESTP